MGRGVSKLRSPLLILIFISVCLDNPRQELFPEHFPLLKHLRLLLVAETGVLHAPKDQLFPSVQTHICFAENNLIKVVRQ